MRPKREREIPMKKRALRFETLEERQLLAVTAGLNAAGLPEPTEAAPAGQRVGDVCISSPIDVDGDGFIGPSELSYMSFAWFSADGTENWNPASDIDGDGFVGPGDYALLSSYWFRTNEALPESAKSYEIYPSNTENWLLFGDRVSKITPRNGTLTLDARTGELEAVCDYEGFADSLRVTADFKTTDTASEFKAGLELAVQESGSRYYAEMQPDRVCLYHIGNNGQMTLLDGAFCSFALNETYTVWGQVSDGTVSFGIGEETLISAADSRLSGGMVGFSASAGVNLFSSIKVENNPDPAGAPTSRIGDVYVYAQFVENGVPLDEPIVSYEIYPSNIENWLLFGEKISKVTARSGSLTVDARTGALEAVCDYGAFPDDLLVIADYRSTDPTVSSAAGIELAVQESGARYYAEFTTGAVSLYYISEGGQMTLLANKANTLAYNRTYTVWAQLAGGRLACGIGGDVLLSVSNTRLSGGMVGFYASEGASVFQNIGIYTGDDLYDTGPTPEEENAELRAEVVAYMRSMATVKWTPAADITYYNPDYGVMFKAGQTYYGVPYSQKVRSGSYESFSSYLNADGVYTGPTGSTSYIGSDCSSAVSMAWRVFDPSLSLLGTYYMFPGRGKIVAVGNYSLTSGSRTAQVGSDNGRDVMYAAYACLQPGDAVLWYKDTGGHVRLITSVDAANQCVYVIEQSGSAGYETPIAGNSTWRVDRKITFASLYDNGYIPISHSGLQIG